MERVSKTFTSDLPQLTAMRAFVRETCGRAWGPDGDKALALLELALDEAAANVILHAYQGQGGLPVELTVEVGPERACVGLFHEGAGFDPQSAPPPVFDASHETGYGMYLIRQAVDEVEYCCDDRGRHGIRLVKKR